MLQDMLENQTENGKENVFCKKFLVLQDIMETLQEELNAKFVHVQILLIPISKKNFYGYFLHLLGSQLLGKP